MSGKRDVNQYRLRRDIEIRRLAREGWTRERIAERIPLSLDRIRTIAVNAR